MRLAISSGFRLRLDHAWDQHLVGWELYSLKQSPFMAMARICCLEGDAVGAHSEGDVDNICKRNVAVVRALIIAPA